MVRDNSQTQQQAGMFANMPMQPVQAQPIPAPPNSVALPPGSIMTAQGQVLQPAAASPYVYPQPAPSPYPSAAPSPYPPGYPAPYNAACSGAPRATPGACGNCPSCRVRGYR